MSTRKFRYDLQPLGDFTQKEANQLKKELEKHLVTIYLTETEVPPKKDIPALVFTRRETDIGQKKHLVS